MIPPLAAVAFSLFLAAAPQRPLLDPNPAVVDGVSYSREQIFEGHYVKDFEHSDFDPLGPKTPLMWLQGWTGGEGAHHIRFIGRRTVRAGHYGHLGAYRHIVLITDLIDVRPPD